MNSENKEHLNGSVSNNDKDYSLLDRLPKSDFFVGLTKLEKYVLILLTICAAGILVIAIIQSVKFYDYLESRKIWKSSEIINYEYKVTQLSEQKFG